LSSLAFYALCPRGIYLGLERLDAGGQVVLLCAAAVLFVMAARRYDMKIFLGIVPMEHGISSMGLDTGGVLALVRHPWYLAGLLLVWARDLTLVDVLVNLVIVIYLWFGSLLEERKLVRAYGEAYRRYQRRVSMLIPWGWCYKGLGE
jgi:protein-S-isoprenylcysteine O-methyltransferase Ste14